jgi:hypothetical protein
MEKSEFVSPLNKGWYAGGLLQDVTDVPDDGTFTTV